MGKSTLIKSLEEYYSNKGKKVATVHFPRYETDIGKIIKEVLQGERLITPMDLQALLCTDRSLWSLKEFNLLNIHNDFIFVDRYTTSGLVYGMTDGLSSEDIMYLSKYIIKPDLNIIITAYTDVIIERIENRKDRKKTIYETTECIADTNLRFSELHSIIPCIHYIDGNKDEFAIFSDAVEIIENHYYR